MSLPSTNLASPHQPEDRRISPRLLFPLNELTDVETLHPASVEGDEMPEPYRGLLVHDRDMTSTLEAFHGEPSRLEPLVQEQRGDGLWRKVILIGVDSDAVQEFGAIRIALDLFPSAARREIIAGTRPLGAILASFNIDYVSRPRHFFSLDADEELRRHFAIHAGTRLRPLESPRLFGRQNVLNSSRGALAEVVEILPPAGPQDPRPREVSSKLKG